MAESSVDQSENDVVLREVNPDDVAIFYRQQLDAEANHMAAFTVKDPSDKKAFKERWLRILSDNNIVKRTILYEGQVAGNVLVFDQFGKRSVGYWLGREFWDKGIATAALKLVLKQVEARPLYARVAKDNRGSMRVLQKSGFVVYGEDKGFAYARGAEIEEYIYRLD
jgi:RimJ/RimL family protein N-acetyltransferase